MEDNLNLQTSPHRIIVASDIHDGHIDWYGVPTHERMARFVADMQAEYERAPYDMILFLGDYSLDHWAYDRGGSWLNDGVSRTAAFMHDVAAKLPAPYYMIPGNHEQYGDAKWLEITGFHRQFSVVWQGILFLMLDTFGGNLDPTAHSDGTYTGMDCTFARAEMAKYPDLPVVLCSHFFNFHMEPRSEEQAVYNDPRVILLLAGHIHRSDILVTPQAGGRKPMLWTGNYSYSAMKPEIDSMWGYRDVWVDDNRLISNYIVSENDVTMDGAPVHIPHAIRDTIRIMK